MVNQGHADKENHLIRFIGKLSCRTELGTQKMMSRTHQQTYAAHNFNRKEY